MYLRKVRLILTNLNYNYSSNIKLYCTEGRVSNLIAKHFGISDQETKNLIKQNQLNTLKYDNVKEILRICDRLGLDRGDVSKHLKIFIKTPRTLEVQYLVLKEVGFSKVTAEHLARFRVFIHKKISTLKALGCIPKHFNVPETLVAYLHPKPVDFNPGEFTENYILSQVHSAIVKQYLMWRLEATRDEIERFFRTYDLKHISLRQICENIELALQVGFTPNKFLKFGYVLSTFTDYPKAVLETMPNLAGCSMAYAMNKYPKLMTVSPSHILKMYKILRQAGIEDFMIKKHMNIFTLSPETVKIRLNEVKQIPEFNVFQKDINLLQLVIHHNRARSRLTFLQQLQMRCISARALGDCPNAFNALLREGRDINGYSSVIKLLVRLLNFDKELFGSKLKQHPLHRHVPLVDIEKTVEYLLASDYDKQSIVKVIPIVLYSKDKIREAFEKIESEEMFKSSKPSKVEKLNLALYYMEKEHHFTGNGIW